MPTCDLSVSYLPTETVPELLIHYAWSWLDLPSVALICQLFPVMSCYARLRNTATSLTCGDIARIRTPLQYDSPNPTIGLSRSNDIAMILLLCDFNFGLFQRFMGHIYTGNFIDFDAIDAAISELRDVPHVPGLPLHDFDRVSHILHNGFPIKHHYQSSRQDCLQRNLYNNHSSIDGYEEILTSKLATDVQNSFACVFPRWMLHFIYGLTLSAMGIDIKMKDGEPKHRLINDPSTPVLGPLDSGNLNQQLDKRNPDHVPPVHYGSAIKRIWTRIYNLRIRRPNSEIIMYKDDIVAAFRRGKYHPDVAAAYAYVFLNWLVIPIGGLFGPRDTPGWFCMTSELRALASLHLSNMPTASHPLSDACEFAYSDESPVLAQAVACSLNTGDITSPGPQTCFVDDTIIIEYAEYIRASAAASILTASLLYGKPPAVQQAVSAAKYMKFFTYYCDGLGIDSDCRNLLAIFPLQKRLVLNSVLVRFDWSKKLKIQVRILASILGKIRHAGQVIPLGDFLAFFLQENVNKHVASHPNSKSAWSRFRAIHISANAAQAIGILQALLAREVTNVWERPIALLILRDPTFIIYSDACLRGLGGYCFLLDFQWRLATTVNSQKVFVISANLQCIDPLLIDDEIHINIFEFIAIIINLFFSILRMHEKHTRARHLTSNGYVLHALSDNTSALSWMRHASRSRAAPTRNLALLLITFLFHANSLFPISTHGFHIAGSLNDRADALSRPQSFPSYNDVWTAYADLRPLQCYRVPQKLIAIINSCLSPRLMPVPSEQEMKQLLAVTLPSLRLFAPP